MIKRREFVILLGGAATAWPAAMRAQQRTMPVVGFLNSGSPNSQAPLVAEFRRGLNEVGFVEHRNFGIEYRWAEGQYSRLPDMADDLVRREVSVIAQPVESARSWRQRQRQPPYPCFSDRRGPCCPRSGSEPRPPRRQSDWRGYAGHRISAEALGSNARVAT